MAYFFSQFARVTASVQDLWPAQHRHGARHGFKRSNVITAIVFVLVIALAMNMPNRADAIRQQQSAAVPLSTLLGGGGPSLPANLPGLAQTALDWARKWQPDAALVQITVAARERYSPVLTFYSPAADSALKMSILLSSLTEHRMSARDISARAPLPGNFLDLSDAVALAQKQGMPPAIEMATLEMTMVAGAATPVWTLTANTGAIYTVDASPSPPAR